MKTFSTVVSWSSHVKVLKRVVKIKNKLCILLQKDRCSIFVELFCVDKWLSAGCYIADIKKKINRLNVSLQGKGDILTMSGKVTVFPKRMLWREHFEKYVLKIISLLKDFIAEKNVSLKKILISGYIKTLETEFSNMFKISPREKCDWVLNPFVKNVKL